MIVDTSVWIEFYNSSQSKASSWLRERIVTSSPVVVPEQVMMELLVGPTNETVAANIRRSLLVFGIEAVEPVGDAEHAAAIHRRCRRAGMTIRSLIDCQIAAMALRLDTPVAHRDRDFEVMAQHCGLQTLPLF